MNKNIRCLIAVAAVLFHVGSVYAQAELKQTRYPNGTLRTEEHRVDGKREGLFREFYPSGRPREAIPYRAGKIHGTRKFYHENGQVSAEIPYSNGIKNGVAKKYASDGKVVAEINYKNDLYNGAYRTFYPSGNPEEESRFVDSKRQGRAVWYYDNRQPKRIGEYVDGNLNGVAKLYSPEGVLLQERTFTNDKLNGPYRTYYRSGELQEEGNFVGENRDGLVTVHYKNQNIRQIRPYKNGKLHGTRKEFSEEGVLLEEIPYVEGRQNGTYRSYHGPNVLREVCPYVDGQRDGLAVSFHPNGLRAEEILYVRGKRQGVSHTWNDKGELIDTKIDLDFDPDSLKSLGDLPYINPSVLKTVKEAIDSKTGNTVSTLQGNDGFELIAAKDREGNVVSMKMKTESNVGFDTTVDPGGGDSKTTITTPGGGQLTVDSARRKNADGSVSIVDTASGGSRVETTVKPDGSVVSEEFDDRGKKIQIAERATDGSVRISSAGKNQTTSETSIRRDGQIIEEIKDPFGNTVGKVTKFPDGREVREDSDGTTTTTTITKKNRIVQTTTSPSGSTSTVVRDADGNVLKREAHYATGKELGQEYYETVLHGADWNRLANSDKTRFANSERQLRETAELRQLRDIQDRNQTRAEEENQRFAERLNKETDAKLAAIARESDEARGQSDARKAKALRKRQIDESYEKAAELNRQYDAAVKKGDFAEARRIMREQDKHHEASMALLEMNDEERAAMERKQALRDKIFAQVAGAARREAQSEVALDWQQDLKESVVKITKYPSIGSQLQELNQKSTRLANYEVANSKALRRRLEKILNDPRTSDEGRHIATDMLRMSDLRLTGALEQLSANNRLTAVGYGFDVATLGTGSLLKTGGVVGAKVLTRVAGQEAAEQITTVLARRGLTDLAKTGTLAATERLAGKQAAHSLAVNASATVQALKTTATQAAELGTKAASRVVGEKTVATVGNAARATGRALSTDVATGKVGESKLLKEAATTATVGAAVDAGSQAVLTGKVDVKEVAKGALVGGVVGSAASRLEERILTPELAPTRKAPSPSGPTSVGTQHKRSVGVAPEPTPRRGTESPRLTEATSTRPSRQANRSAEQTRAAAARDAQTVKLDAKTEIVRNDSPNNVNDTLRAESPTVKLDTETVVVRKNKAGNNFDETLRADAPTVKLDTETVIVRKNRANRSNTETLRGNSQTRGRLDETLRADSPTVKLDTETVVVRKNRADNNFDETLRADAPTVKLDTKTEIVRGDRPRGRLDETLRADSPTVKLDTETVVVRKNRANRSNTETLRSNSPIRGRLDETLRADSPTVKLDTETTIVRKKQTGDHFNDTLRADAPTVKLDAETEIVRNKPRNSATLRADAHATSRTRTSTVTESRPEVSTARLEPPELPGSERLASREHSRVSSTSETLPGGPKPLSENWRPHSASAPAKESNVGSIALNRPPGYLEKNVFGGRSMTIRSPTGDIRIEVGDFINEGSFNQVYHLKSRSGKVMRVSRGPSDHVYARFDGGGRNGLKSIEPNLDGELEFVHAETYDNVQSSDPRLNGRTVSIMDHVDVRASEQLKRNPDRLPTAGQAIAYDRGIRALNRNGYAALDTHPANFYFRETGPNDEWVMVILDPGGIVPTNGATAAERAANARELQALVDNPANRSPSNPKDRGKYEHIAKAYYMQPSLERLVDARKAGLTDVGELFTGFEPIFRPSGAEDFPKVRELFGKSDHEVEAAYRKLRERYGRP